jgi:hypothetical protein
VPPGADTAPLDARTERICDELLEALPTTVDGAERRELRPADAPAAAWGDPAIVLRCGIARPPGLDEFATCQEADGVGWYVPEKQITGQPRPITMTTIGRAVFVQVSLPEEHWPPAAAMVDLAPAVREAVPQLAPCV